jgi:hypothetical protein
MAFRIIGPFAVVIALVAQAQLAHAQPAPVFSPPACEKPDDRVLRNRPGNDADSVMAYNAKVHRFNRLSAAFTDCVKAYIVAVNLQIDQVRTAAQARTRQIVERANARIHAIEAQVNAAVAVGNGGTAPAIPNPDPDFPLAACDRPADSAPDYATRRRAFEACTRDYIERGKQAMQQAKDKADHDQQQVTADANQRIQLLNTLAQQTGDGDQDNARKTFGQLNGLP